MDDLRVSYETFITLATNKGLPIQYTESPIDYWLVLMDGGLMWTALIPKESPEGIEFESEYKDSSNGGADPHKSYSARIVSINVNDVGTSLLPINANRKGLIVQTTDPIFLSLTDTVSPTNYSYDVPKKGCVEIEGYCGVCTACTHSGSCTVLVTEKI